MIKITKFNPTSVWYNSIQMNSIINSNSSFTEDCHNQKLLIEQTYSYFHFLRRKQLHFLNFLRKTRSFFFLRIFNNGNMFSPASRSHGITHECVYVVSFFFFPSHCYLKRWIKLIMQFIHSDSGERATKTFCSSAHTRFEFFFLFIL